MAQRTATAPRTIVSGNRRKGLLRLALVGVLLVISTGYVSPAINYFNKTREIEREQAANDELRQRNEQLKMEKERLLEIGFVEEMARRDLGLIKPGEQPYIVKDIGQENTRPVAADTETAPSDALSAFLAVFFPE